MGTVAERHDRQIDYRRMGQFIRSLPVKDPEKRIVPFKPRPGQQRFLQHLETLQDDHRLPRTLIVKSRRVGISKICTAILVAHCLAIKNADARITAHLQETARDLFNAAALMWRKLRLNTEVPTRSIVKFQSGESGASLTCGTARTVAGGRGLGFSSLLATEAAYYDKEESFEALVPTIPLKPDFFVFIESTANGREGKGGPFYEQYNLAVEGQSDFSVFFLGPQEDPDCIITDARLAKEIMARPTDQENRDEETDLVKRFKLNQGQLAWRRVQLSSPTCRGSLKKLHTEYPYDADSAFVASGDAVFEKEELRFAEECVKASPRPTKCDIRVHGEPGDRTVSRELGGGPILMWRMPERGHSYYIGADAAKGTATGDFAAAVVWDGNSGEQVAQFAERASVLQFADYLDRLGRYFGQGMPTKQAMVNIEISCGHGSAVQQILRDQYRYSNFYRWRSKDDRLVKETTRRTALGWETTTRTRPMLVDHFRTNLEKKELIVRSEILYSQMARAEQEFGMRWDVVQGHDDVLMAAMIGWMAVVQWPPMDLSYSRVGARKQEADVIAQPGSAVFFETVKQMGKVASAHRLGLDRPKTIAEMWYQAHEGKPVSP